MWWKILIAVALMAYVIFPDALPFVVDDIAAFSGSLVATIAAIKQVTGMVKTKKKAEDTGNVNDVDDN